MTAAQYRRLVDHVALSVKWAMTPAGILEWLADSSAFAQLSKSLQTDVYGAFLAPGLSFAEAKQAALARLRLELLE